MVSLAGYKDFQHIHDSSNSQVYRARRIEDGQSVILKFLNQDYPSSEQIRRYKQEYYITRQFDSPGIIKAYSLEEWQRSYAIVLEDFGGISLRQWRRERQRFSLEALLSIAIATTESLGHIHAQNVIHKDINPANIVFNPDTKELKVIDFGISTQLSREIPTLKHPNILEGTLAYISPEQTGRMNRGVDYRTDFYSLGVTLYEFLTGTLPFMTDDALELVYCHIAKTPEFAICNSQFAIPEVLIAIVMKLMAKNAEDRYQSTWGLQADLEICLQQVEKIGTIEPFALGQQDILDRFQIPQKLYGREEEIPKLLEVFERVIEQRTVKLLLVAGYSGVGKSSLVQELFKPITACRGYFISGKFDQFQRNIPYSAIVAAFRGLIEQLLGESEQQLQIWREKLLQALGTNGQIIIDVIPEIELIIGKQTPVPILEGNEAQNRFNLIFGRFINVFCDKVHPLTLFLDDLQWADLATLQLMERLLMEGQNQYLLLLGAYRDNEVFAAHPLVLTLTKIQQHQGEYISQITLKPLPLDKITDLIEDTLRQTSESIKELAQLVLQKTGGNPFFINEFLQALYNKKLLQFDRQARKWQWDMAAIEARNFTDNVVELMVERLQQFSPSCQEILSVAACLGAEFNLEFLTWVINKSPQETFELLKIALNHGFILPLSELDENLLIQSYKFTHDRIQQAAYALIPEDRKESTHYQIGRVLLQNLPPEVTEESIFELVSQLNYGTALINEQEERDELAQLNLIACRKAREATAYQAAREYASTGLSLLGVHAWQRQYEMSLAFHNLAAELAALCGDLEAMEQLVETTIDRVRSLLEQVNVYHIKIRTNNAQDKHIDNIDLGQQILRKFGIVFPETPTQDDAQQAIAKVGELIGDREIEDFIHMPIMKNREKIAIMQIVNSIIPSALSSNFPLALLLIALSIELSIQYGNTPTSCFAYVLYGYICCSLLHDVERGVKFSQLALQLVSKLDAKVAKPEVLNIVGLFILHRQSYIKDVLPLSQEGYNSGLDCGSYQFAGFCASDFCINSFWCGQPLDTLEQEARAYCNRLVQLNQLKQANLCRIYWQCALNLLGFTKQPSVLSGEALQEEELLSIEVDLYRSGLFYAYKLMLCYLFGESESARNNAIEGRRYFPSINGTVVAPAFYFYDSLTALATSSLDWEETSEVFEQVEENQNQLKHWAYHAPMNHQHKVDLVEAEKCRVLGQKAGAIELYNKAISGAKENEYIQEEALANELTAKFYLDWNQETAARAYMTEAHYCYSLWGATAKVKYIEDNYPQFFQSSTARTSTNKTSSKDTSSSSSISLDLTTFIKASQSISSEIILSQLLAQLIKILLENTGAQSVFLILETEGKLLIEAEARANGEIAVLHSMPLEFVKPNGSVPLLSSAVVNYVARTRESVILNDARNEGNFTREPYIQDFQVKSVLCVPLVEQGKLIGLAYLENNLSVGVFTGERVEIVQLLSGQAAIAISNAQLYSQVQEREQQIKQLYDASQRFVPEQFLSFLEKKSIVDVELGDQVEREMTVLFSDIRDFTTISERMTPVENFAFINEYLGYMEPLIQAYGGFIDKYIGDAIMALFANSADDAVKGAIAMLEQLKQYNQVRQRRNQKPLRIGIGLHTGTLILGTVGGLNRMDGTVIGDAVNLSSRVEGLTKTYGVSLLLTDLTWNRLNNSSEYDFRFIDKVKAKGKNKAVSLFEIFSADPPELREAKTLNKGKFERAVLLYHEESFQEAARLFQECLEYHEGDRAARCYLERCYSNCQGG